MVASDDDKRRGENLELIAREGLDLGSSGIVVALIGTDGTWSSAAVCVGHHVVRIVWL